MVNEKSACPQQSFFRETTLTLQPHGGRVFAHHAAPGQLNHQTIELKCECRDQAAFFSKKIVIGEEVHSASNHFESDEENDRNPVEEEIGWRLNDIPIILTIYKVDEVMLREHQERRGDNPLIGQLSYNPRVNTADGLVNHEWPQCSAWIFVGEETFRMIRNHIVNFEEHSFEIGIGVVFPEESVEHGWIGKTVNWNGEGQLAIESAVAVWAQGDWQANVRRRIESDSNRECEPSGKHTEILAMTRKIEHGIRAALPPLWIIVLLIAFWLVDRH